jgi:hypothetical protein
VTSRPDPERRIVRRVAPWAALGVPAGFAIGALAAGWGVGASAAVGLALVVLNAVANAESAARAARISLTAYSAVVAGGVIVRLGVIVGVMVGLSHLHWFSRLAFGLAVVPGTIALLALELRVYGAGVGRELVLPNRGAA